MRYEGLFLVRLSARLSRYRPAALTPGGAAIADYIGGRLDLPDPRRDEDEGHKVSRPEAARIWTELYRTNAWREAMNRVLLRSRKIEAPGSTLPGASFAG